jgi:hypothetical protein
MENQPTQNLKMPERIKAFREYLGLSHIGFASILTPFFENDIAHTTRKA